MGSGDVGHCCLRVVQLGDVALHLPNVGKGLGRFTSHGSGILIRWWSEAR